MIYTKYASRVDIVEAFRPNQKDTDFFLAIGGFLVKAVVTQPGRNSVAAIEQSQTAVLSNDPIHQGWISTNDLVADMGSREILQACLGAPTGTPQNYEALLKLYWPGIFGHLTPTDFSDTTFAQTGAGVGSAVRRMVGLS